MFWGFYVGPTIANNQTLLLDGTAQSSRVRILPEEKVQIPARLLSSVLTFVAVVSPIGLEASEGVLIIVGQPTSPASYILAVLDMVKVVPSLPFAFSFVFHVVPRMWGGAWRGLVEPAGNRQ